MELKYSDEEDRSYGVAGMAACLIALKADNMLARVDLDAPDSMEFVPEYYFTGNPRLSAKVAWQYMVKRYHESMNMVIGNVLCRHYMHHHSSLDAATRATLMRYMEQEGAEACSLESDEIRRLFNDSYQFLDTVFSDHEVQKIIRNFASSLRRQRSLTRGDIADLFAPLREI